MEAKINAKLVEKANLGTGKLKFVNNSGVTKFSDEIREIRHFISLTFPL